MEKLIIRKKKKMQRFIYLLLVGLSWIVIGSILFFVCISYTNLYTDNLITIFLLLGFPLDNLMEIIYLLFFISTLLIIPLFYKLCTEFSEEEIRGKI